MRKHGYLVVEGPHDVEFVYRLLSPYRLKRVRMIDNLDPFFKPLVPKSFPPDGDLLKRVPIPHFFQSDSHSIAVHSAMGVTRLIQTLQENAALIDPSGLTAIGIVLDSDAVVDPVRRYSDLLSELQSVGLEFPKAPGMIAPGQPRLGAFVLPDNQSRGTLEDLLLECAGHVYPGLLRTALTHVDSSLLDASLNQDDREDLQKPAGRNKAIIGSIASILRPGKAIQVSIQDNRWLRGPALELPKVRAVQEFLAELLELG